jgi:hypothetical protein
VIGSPRARFAAVAAAAVGLVLAAVAVIASSSAGESSPFGGVEADQQFVAPSAGDLDDRPAGVDGLPAVAAVAPALAAGALVVALVAASAPHLGRLVPAQASARAPPRRPLGH